MSAELRDAQEGPFEDWWNREGQYLRAGGDSYSKTFAWHAWCEATARAAQAPAAEPAKLWLWKNFVDGRPEYWAFDNAFPVHMDGGDPQTLGEPCGYAIFKPSRQGHTDVPEAEVLRRISEAKPEQSAVVAALRKLDKAAMDVVWAQNQHEARTAVHWLSEAAKESHAALKAIDA